MTDDSQGHPRKIIVFTEHKDTLSYLRGRITALPGRAEAVVEIHGAMDMRERRRVQHRFTQDPNTTVLLATDAAGEGLNLQAAHLMVNYDLPWNPNRIEQRFGRIHRIGQKETCHLWSLVAEDTREGAVFIRLLEKMEEQAASLGGKVYDVLGETFEGEPLERLLARAVREGEGARRHLERIIDARVGDELPRLLEQRALYREVLLPVDIEGARRRADLGQRTRLQPHLASAWFAESVHVLGGRVQLRADGTAEVLRVPEVVRERARAGTVLNARYGNVRFAPEQEQPATAGGTVLGPGSPLFDALADTVAERYASSSVSGTLLIDPTGRDDSTRLLAAVGHEIVDGRAVSTALSRRFEIVEIDESAAGAAAGLRHLDYRAATDQELTQLLGMRGTAFVDPVSLAMRWAVSHLVAEHTTDVRNSHGAATERRREAINDRLRNLSPSDPVAGRLRHRLERLAEEAQIVSRRPRIHAVALVVPASVFGITPQVDSVASLEVATARTVRDLEEQGLAATSTEVGAVQVDRGGETVWIDVRVGDGAGHRLRMARSDVIQGANLGGRYRLALVDRGTSGTSQRPMADCGWTSITNTSSTSSGRACGAMVRATLMEEGPVTDPNYDPLSIAKDVRSWAKRTVGHLDRLVSEVNKAEAEARKSSIVVPFPEREGAILGGTVAVPGPAAGKPVDAMWKAVDHYARLRDSAGLFTIDVGVLTCELRALVTATKPRRRLFRQLPPDPAVVDRLLELRDWAVKTGYDQALAGVAEGRLTAEPSLSERVNALASVLGVAAPEGTPGRVDAEDSELVHTALRLHAQIDAHHERLREEVREAYAKAQDRKLDIELARLPWTRSRRSATEGCGWGRWRAPGSTMSARCCGWVEASPSCQGSAKTAHG